MVVVRSIGKEKVVRGYDADEVLKSVSIFKDTKRFYFDLKENHRGRFLKVVKSLRVSIYIREERELILSLWYRLWVELGETINGTGCLCWTIIGPVSAEVCSYKMVHDWIEAFLERFRFDWFFDRFWKLLPMQFTLNLRLYRIITVY